MFFPHPFTHSYVGNVMFSDVSSLFIWECFCGLYCCLNVFVFSVCGGICMCASGAVNMHNFAGKFLSAIYKFSFIHSNCPHFFFFNFKTGTRVSQREREREREREKGGGRESSVPFTTAVSVGNRCLFPRPQRSMYMPRNTYTVSPLHDEAALPSRGVRV